MPRQPADRRMLNLRAAAIVISAAAVVTLRVRLYLEQNITRAPYESGYLTRRTFVRRITHAENHYVALLRMDVRCFRSFVGLFRNTTLLEDTIHCTVEELVAIFLSVIAHNERNRTVRATTRRSGATVSKYFNKVLDAVLILQDMFIVRPSRETPRAILDNPNFMPYFKDFISAIDGTHIHAKVSQDIQKRYICRKHFPSQNLLACCDFDLKFTYVLCGWEGSAPDSRVLASAISKLNGIPILPGKFYLGDAGYPCLSHFITPIRGICYHLNQIRGRRPRKAEELYNQRHSSARNIDIVLACCCVHNHIRREMPDDSYIQDVDDELASLLAEEEEEEEGPVPPPPMTRAEDVREGEMATTAGTTEKKANVAWNGAMDGVILAALKNQIAEGQKTGAGFKECAYNAVAHEVSDVLNKTLTKENVKNRLKTLKTTYRTLNSIINLSGFGWDETLCKISVGEEVKNDYLKMHPENQSFFSKRYPLYEEMKAVCDDDYARGEEVRDRRAVPTQATQETPGASSSTQPVGLDDMDDSFLRTPPRARPSSSTPAVDASMGYSDSSPIRGPTSATGGKKSKKRPNAALVSELQVVSSSINRVADAIISTGEVHSLPDLKDAVLNIGGFPRGDLLDAYVYLHGRHKEAEAFLSLDDMDRTEMLGRIMRRLPMQL
ncbi:uncharacterized protein LOC143886941 [Tasmannia lanceolata]|uniref:uncharacterized protein LOC143886941 n=1 Tax=Tasmannia lanceolata TaxID=3420 RepID=UPI0040633970